MDKKVKVYTAPSCHYCHQAKDYLTEKGIDFDTFDVTQDKDALQEMKKVSGGARSVPVITVCDKVMMGFDRAALDKALECLQS